MENWLLRYRREEMEQEKPFSVISVKGIPRFTPKTLDHSPLSTSKRIPCSEWMAVYGCEPPARSGWIAPASVVLA